MNYEALFAQHAARTVRAGLVGVGQFGVSLVVQSRAVPLLEVVALCTRASTDRANSC